MSSDQYEPKTNVPDSLADTFLRIAELKERHPGSITTLNAIERNVHKISKELYGLSNQLRRIRTMF